MEIHFSAGPFRTIFSTWCYIYDNENLSLLLHPSPPLRQTFLHCFLCWWPFVGLLPTARLLYRLNGTLLFSLILSLLWFFYEFFSCERLLVRCSIQFPVKYAIKLPQHNEWFDLKNKLHCTYIPFKGSKKKVCNHLTLTLVLTLHYTLYIAQVPWIPQNT